MTSIPTPQELLVRTLDDVETNVNVTMAMKFLRDNRATLLRGGVASFETNNTDAAYKILSKQGWECVVGYTWNGKIPSFVNVSAKF